MFMVGRFFATYAMNVGFQITVEVFSEISVPVFLAIDLSFFR